MAGSRPRLKPLWWVYFGVMVLLQLLSFFALPGGRVVDFLWFCLGNVGLIGLAGYLLQRPFVARSFWMAFFGVSAGGMGYVLLSLPLEVFTDYAVLVALGLMAPSLWAYFAYAFRSEHLWFRRHAGLGI